MMPGLHPGLLIASDSGKLELEGLPQSLHIDTSGGPGNRTLGLSAEVINGQAPFTFSWSLGAAGFNPVPDSGSGTSNDGYVSFFSQVYHGGGETNFTEVGAASLTVIDSAGRRVDVNVPVTAGGSGTGGGPPGAP